jgi:thiol-disulfide isomerase/thioredoxin
MTGYFASAKCAVMAALVAGAGPAQGATTGYPSDSILLFVAAWCAPCHAELRRLDEIEAAAGPRAVRIVPLDDDPRTAAMLRMARPQQIWRPAGAAWDAVRDDLSVRTAGLPFSLATDGRGQICGESRHGLDAIRTRQLIDRCARG